MPSTVIKTGRLSIRLGHDDLGKAVDRANQVVDRYGGFISSSNISSGRHEIVDDRAARARRRGSTRP